MTRTSHSRAGGPPGGRAGGPGRRSRWRVTRNSKTHGDSDSRPAAQPGPGPIGRLHHSTSSAARTAAVGPGRRRGAGAAGGAPGRPHSVARYTSLVLSPSLTHSHERERERERERGRDTSRGAPSRLVCPRGMGAPESTRGAYRPVPLSLSLSHTHTHTRAHTHSLSLANPVASRCRTPEGARATRSHPGAVRVSVAHPMTRMARAPLAVAVMGPFESASEPGRAHESHAHIRLAAGVIHGGLPSQRRPVQESFPPAGGRRRQRGDERRVVVAVSGGGGGGGREPGRRRRRARTSESRTYPSRLTDPGIAPPPVLYPGAPVPRVSESPKRPYPSHIEPTSELHPADKEQDTIVDSPPRSPPLSLSLLLALPLTRKLDHLTHHPKRHFRLSISAAAATTHCPSVSPSPTHPALLALRSLACLLAPPPTLAPSEHRSLAHSIPPPF